MTVNEAITKFKKHYPDSKLRGYWLDGNNVIICTKQKSNKLMETCLFIVSDGGIVPTNPVKSRIVNEEKITKI